MVCDHQNEYFTLIGQRPAGGQSLIVGATKFHRSITVSHQVEYNNINKRESSIVRHDHTLYTPNTRENSAKKWHDINRNSCCCRNRSESDYSDSSYDSEDSEGFDATDVHQPLVPKLMRHLRHVTRAPKNTVHWLLDYVRREKTEKEKESEPLKVLYRRFPNIPFTHEVPLDEIMRTSATEKKKTVCGGGKRKPAAPNYAKTSNRNSGNIYYGDYDSGYGNGRSTSKAPGDHFESILRSTYKEDSSIADYGAGDASRRTTAQHRKTSSAHKRDKNSKYKQSKKCRCKPSKTQRTLKEINDFYNGSVAVKTDENSDVIARKDAAVQATPYPYIPPDFTPLLHMSKREKEERIRAHDSKRALQYELSDNYEQLLRKLDGKDDIAQALNQFNQVISATSTNTDPDIDTDPDVDTDAFARKWHSKYGNEIQRSTSSIHVFSDFERKSSSEVAALEKRNYHIEEPPTYLIYKRPEKSKPTKTAIKPKPTPPISILADDNKMKDRQFNRRGVKIEIPPTLKSKKTHKQNFNPRNTYELLLTSSSKDLVKTVKTKKMGHTKSRKKRPN